jgi:Flp pilus assembly pilin Flp
MRTIRDEFIEEEKRVTITEKGLRVVLITVIISLFILYLSTTIDINFEGEIEAIRNLIASLSEIKNFAIRGLK